jgi:hypothetical protein
VHKKVHKIGPRFFYLSDRMIVFRKNAFTVLMDCQTSAATLLANYSDVQPDALPVI